MNELTEYQLLELSALVFESTHSNGFKVAEIKAVLLDKDYWFLEKPKDNWKYNVLKFLTDINYDKSLLNINPNLQNNY